MVKREYNIETHVTGMGTEFKFMKSGRFHGKNYLLKLGYKSCRNPMFVEKDGEYFHYNKLLKGWTTL